MPLKGCVNVNWSLVLPCSREKTSAGMIRVWILTILRKQHSDLEMAAVAVRMFHLPGWMSGYRFLLFSTLTRFLVFFPLKQVQVGVASCFAVKKTSQIYVWSRPRPVCCHDFFFFFSWKRRVSILWPLAWNDHLRDRVRSWSTSVTWKIAVQQQLLHKKDFCIGKILWRHQNFCSRNFPL